MAHSASRARMRGVGYVYRVTMCSLDEKPHEHVKLGASAYVCAHAATWCESCGVPRADADQPCAGCAHLRTGRYE